MSLSTSEIEFEFWRYFYNKIKSFGYPLPKFDYHFKDNLNLSFEQFLEVYHSQTEEEK